MTRQSLVLYQIAHGTKGDSPKPILTKGHEISMAPGTQSAWMNNSITQPPETLCFLTGTGSVVFQDDRRSITIVSPVILKFACGSRYAIHAGPTGMWFSITPVR